MSPNQRLARPNTCLSAGRFLSAYTDWRIYCVANVGRDILHLRQSFLDLETGTFIRTGVNWNQVGIYSVDAISTSAVAGGLGFGIYFGSR